MLALAFKIWPSKERIRHCYYKNPMRNQVLTEKRSSMTEQSKMAFLSDEIDRRFLMMINGITIDENIEKVNQYTYNICIILDTLHNKKERLL